MTFLLKIVQGPNAGAEVALLEGVTVSLGKGDACDIILSDTTVADKACELEVSGERVMMLFPDGKQARLEPYHVRMLGTTACVVGPAEGAWKPLVWPEAHAVPAVVEETPTTEPEQKNAPQVKTEARQRHPIRMLVFLFLLVLLLGVGVIYFFYPEIVEKGKAYVLSSESSPVEQKAVKESKAESVDMLAERYQLQMTTTPSGVVRLVGDFASRMERLQATAHLYRAVPGVELDLTDAESLTNAIENVLSLAANGQIRLASLEGRTAYLKGSVASEEDLRRILEALSADVPKLVKADCVAVTLPAGMRPVAAQTASVETAPVAPTVAPAVNATEEAPQLPIVGILTAPYPCLVLRDGSRVMEGAHVGNYTITTIAVDHIVLTGAKGSFTWRP